MLPQEPGGINEAGRPRGPLRAGRQAARGAIIIHPMSGPKTGIECEIKLRVDSVQEGIDRIGRLPAQLERASRFEDNEIFDTAERRLAAAGCLLRLRVVDGRGLVTFKEPVTSALHAKVRAEVESEVGDPGAIRAIFLKSGFRRVWRYQKYRSDHAWVAPDSGEALAISLDRTPIGTWLELEGPMDAIDRAAARMGFTRDDYVLDDYRSLHRAWIARRGEGASDMVFGDGAGEEPPAA